MFMAQSIVFRTHRPGKSKIPTHETKELTTSRVPSRRMTAEKIDVKVFKKEKERAQ